MQNYLTISSGEDLKEGKEKILYRLFETFPGFLSWGTLVSAILFSWLVPVAVAIFIILFDLYWLMKITYLTIHQVSSFLQMKKNLRINWLKKLNGLGKEKIYHLIILPFYKERKEIIRKSLEAIMDCAYPKEKMIVVLAAEERGGTEAKETARQMERDFSKSFFRFLVTIHPKNIPGEIAGKGSNVAWAVKEAREKIIEPLKIPSEFVIVSNFDIDTRPYRQYFSCLTFHYLTTKNAERCSYQPIPVYNNNIWQAPAFSRVVATSGTFWQMMQQERPEILVSYSSHSLSLKTLEEVGYPRNVVSDDSRIFWKSYFYYDGDYRVVPIHYPVSMDAVLAESLSRTIANQYKQQRRWAWGAENIPYLFFGFLKNKKISLWEKAGRAIDILDGFWSWATSSLLIFFLGWLPLILGGEKFKLSLLSYNLPRITRNLMTLAMGGMIVSAVLSFLIFPPSPRKRRRLRQMSMLFQWLLLPVTLIAFGSLPALDAQTRLMAGRRLGFWSTEKAT